MTEWKNEYQGVFPDLTELKLALDLWTWYFAITEEFDRTLPGYWNERQTSWLPDNLWPWAKTSSNIYAKECMDVINEFWVYFGIEDGIWRTAKRRALEEVYGRRG